MSNRLLRRDHRTPTLDLNFLGMNEATFDKRITFSRASHATMYDSTGKLTFAPNNVWTYSNDFTNGAWVKWAASGGSTPVVTANAGTDPFGGNDATRLQLNHNGGSGVSALERIATTPSVNIVSIWMKSNTGLSQNVTLSDHEGITFSVVVVTTSWQRFSIKATAAGTGIILGTRTGFWGTGADQVLDILIYGAQCELVTYETSPRPYNATTTAAYYGPRLEYDPVTLAAKGLLVEEARTNAQAYSIPNTSAPASWTYNNVTAAADNAASPDGTTTATRLTSTSTNAAYIYRAQTVTADVWTQSVYAKKGTVDWVWVRAADNSAATYFNGTIGTGGATSTITAVGNGWYRCTVTSTLGGTPGYSVFGISDADNSDAVTNGGYAFVWGAQCELGSFATSYIPTTTASVTRAVDAVSITGGAYSQWYNQSQGTISIGVTAFKDDVNYTGIFDFNNTTNTPSLGHHSSTAWQAWLSNGSILGSFGAVVVGARTNLILAYKSGEHAFTQDAGALTTSSDSTILAIATSARIGLSGVGPHNGYISRLRYWPTRIANSELRARSV